MFDHQNTIVKNYANIVTTFRFYDRILYAIDNFFVISCLIIDRMVLRERVEL